MGKSSNEYDVAIIGAGIGGLVCGCYLAKAGMKVLIAEQHSKPGGYCTSFKRGEFLFDAAPHCFGSYREEGMLRKIFTEIGIDKKLNIIRANPSDIIITPDYKINFFNNLTETIEDLQNKFPSEKDNIKIFFNILIDKNPNSFSKMRKLTFKDLLELYIEDYKLKSILSFPFLGIGGLSSSKISAFVGAKLYSEFIFDGGYYPKYGMQTIPNLIADKIKQYGGEIILSDRVKKIKVENNSAKGIILGENGFIKSKYVISACDARQTYFKLLGSRYIGEEFSKKLRKMIPSVSNFILYLGIDKKIKTILEPGITYSFYPNYNIEKAFDSIKECDIIKYGGFMLRIAFDKSTIIAITPVPFRNKSFWITEKNNFGNKFISQIKNTLIPDLSNYLIYIDSATPYTLYRYTLNYKGASFGWASIPSQIAMHDIRRISNINNFFLIGHWSTLGIGISGTAYTGYEVAKFILKKERY